MLCSALTGGQKCTLTDDQKVPRSSDSVTHALLSQGILAGRRAAQEGAQNHLCDPAPQVLKVDVGEGAQRAGH